MDMSGKKKWIDDCAAYIGQHCDVAAVQSGTITSLSVPENIELGLRAGVVVQFYDVPVSFTETEAVSA